MTKISRFSAALAAFALSLGALHATLPPAPGQTAAATGSTAPELDVAAWAQGTPAKIADYKGKKYVVLFFWTISAQGTKFFPDVARLAKEFEKKDVVFLGVGIDSAKSVSEFARLKELPFPVAADNRLNSVNLYMRERDRIPMAAVIDKEGVLVWRGSPAVLEQALNEITEDKYDLKQSIERERFSQSVMDAMKVRDYPTVLKLLNSELVKYPDNMELISFKTRLLATLLKQPDEALNFLNETIKRDPKNLKLHEMGVIVLRDEKRWSDLSGWFDRIITTFADQPVLLVKFAEQEMNQPVEQLRVENACKLCRAAYRAPKFKNDREKGFVFGEYARSLYYCGRPDKALEVAKEAMVLLKGTPEFEKAESYVNYYNRVLILSRQIQ